MQVVYFGRWGGELFGGDNEEFAFGALIEEFLVGLSTVGEAIVGDKNNAAAVADGCVHVFPFVWVDEWRDQDASRADCFFPLSFSGDEIGGALGYAADFYGRFYGVVEKKKITVEATSCAAYLQLQAMEEVLGTELLHQISARVVGDIIVECVFSAGANGNFVVESGLEQREILGCSGSRVMDENMGAWGDFSIVIM